MSLLVLNNLSATKSLSGGQSHPYYLHGFTVLSGLWENIG